MKLGAVNLNPKYKQYVREKVFNFFNQYTERYGYTEPVFVCIGTPNVPGDAIGPYVGTLLKRFGYKVYGTEYKPITAQETNMIQKRLWIKNFLDSPIVAIDAAMGIYPLGTIDFAIGKGMEPGAGFDKKLPVLGNSNIKVIVAKKENRDDIYTMDNNIIMGISECLAYAIHCELQKRRAIVLSKK